MLDEEEDESEWSSPPPTPRRHSRRQSVFQSTCLHVVFVFTMLKHDLEFSSNVLDEEEDEYEPFQAPDPSPSKRLRRSR